LFAGYFLEGDPKFLAGCYVRDSNLHPIMLCSISLNNNPIIQIKNKETPQNNKEQEVPLPDGSIQMLRHLLESRINPLLHDVQPSLRHRHLEHGRHGFKNIIKVGIGFNPVASVVHALLHRLDVGPKIWRDVIVVAVVEASLEVVDPEDPEQEEDQKAEEEKVDHVWE
jgi:hypothetical protein